MPPQGTQQINVNPQLKTAVDEAIGIGTGDTKRMDDQLENLKKLQGSPTGKNFDLFNKQLSQALENAIPGGWGINDQGIRENMRQDRTERAATIIAMLPEDMREKLLEKLDGKISNDDFGTAYDNLKTETYAAVIAAKPEAERKVDLEFYKDQVTQGALEQEDYDKLEQATDRRVKENEKKAESLQPGVKKPAKLPPPPARQATPDPTPQGIDGGSVDIAPELPPTTPTTEAPSTSATPEGSSTEATTTRRDPYVNNDG